MHAILYGRVSTAIQEISTQETRCREYAQFHKLDVARELYDDDTSGSIPIWEREHGRQVKALLEAKDSTVKHLVVAKLDRLGRNAGDLLKTFSWLNERGITLHIVDMGGNSLSTNGPAGKLMFTLLAAFAEFERDLIRSRIADRLHAKRAHGELIGTVPYGWTAEETGATTNKGVKVRRVADCPAEQQWILYMADRRTQGASYHAIAKELNAQGVATKRGRGDVIKYAGESRFTSGLWQSGNVSHVLNNKTVCAWLVAQGRAVAA